MCGVREWREKRLDRSTFFFAGELHDFLRASELWTSVTSAMVLGRPSNHNGWFCKTKNFLFLCAEYVWSRWVKRKTSWQKCIFFAGELHNFLGPSELWTTVTSARVLGRPSNHNSWFRKTKTFLFLCVEYVWSARVKRKTSWQKCKFRKISDLRIWFADFWKISTLIAYNFFSSL